MGLDFVLVHGQTPLDEEEKEGLLIPTITTRTELDEAEQINIQEAIRWTMGGRFSREEIISEKFVKHLHLKMFGQVWSWAGAFRKSNKNLGVDRYQVPTHLATLVADAKYWIEHGTYLPDEIAVRFKHRIVSIHCFANGNGRHSRLMADLIAEKILGQHVFTWGSGVDLSRKGQARKEYLEAIKTADAGDIEPLIAFARK